MLFRKKMRKRLLILLVIAFGFVFWRGLHSTTKKTHDCSFKIVYAICEPKTANAAFPSVMEIISAGIKF